MSDGLVRKSDVQKLINLYFDDCIQNLESITDCLTALQYGMELTILIDDMKEVEDDETD